MIAAYFIPGLGWVCWLFLALLVLGILASIVFVFARHGSLSVDGIVNRGKALIGEDLHGELDVLWADTQFQAGCFGLVSAAGGLTAAQLSSYI